jgi:PIN domain nuclease of toxin-antitoxin system
MNVLLDTHALLWFSGGDERLSPTARAAMEDPTTTAFISMASWWEMAIKCSLGKLVLDDPLDRFISKRRSEGFRVLPIETVHLSALIELPFHHRDPFDRLIVAQAAHEGMAVCSGDVHFALYSVSVIW